MTAIILLNWNGADDTLDCLKSLEKAAGDFCVIVADNGSTDDSLKRLEAYASNAPIRIEILPLGFNYGFAIGNNKAVKYAQEKYHPEYFMLLNNDTVVKPDFLSEIFRYSAQHPDYDVFTPRINYWKERERIWMCGGQLTFGSRTSTCRDCLVSSVSLPEFVPVTFISGCALLCKSGILESDGKLLTERFFFGEEDYEFALRMKKKGVRMACINSSVIYHKVGNSLPPDPQTRLGRFYMYYLGRLIIARYYYGTIPFLVILNATILKCRKFFEPICHEDTDNVLRCLRKDAKTKEGIDYNDYKALLLEHNYFQVI